VFPVFHPLHRNFVVRGPLPVHHRADELQPEEQIATRHQQELMAEIERLRLEMRDLRTALVVKAGG
jgi:hypothetical protein